MQVLLQQIVCELNLLGRAFVGRHRSAIFKLLLLLELLAIDLQDFLQSFSQFFPLFRLQLLKALVQFHLDLQVCLLAIAFGDLFVLFVARLEEDVLKVVAKPLH